MPAAVTVEINHLVLNVSDLKRSRNFYMEVLGFADRTQQVNPGQAESTHPTMSFLVAGAQGLDLFEAPEGEAEGGQHLNHIGLSVEEDDLSAAIDLLKKAGVEVSEPTPRNTVFISDPDGNRIEILPGQARVRQL
jgi:catechol 2,3-dioxygenase-like lactoylglutathione lyase family enzyme